MTTVAAARPDLVVLDIRMPPTFTDEGARVATTIKKDHPEVGVLLLSQHIETAHAVTLVAQEGFGYLLKDRVLEVGDFLATAERSPARARGPGPPAGGTPDPVARPRPGGVTPVPPGAGPAPRYAERAAVPRQGLFHEGMPGLTPIACVG
ncbi:hypothetical protein Psuf_073700 [Phytohabitans suffuscus]|uniref:Response regulatory domain-containing protein n=1 Tax=Phytohabitans suffuscus TaxID=624315 RepID=A0A6F8YV91_9ACTN|nr:hypothetical protein Psuf_073700 [Phytohabitans suffuscus]